ncbi:hypothetical protein POM88_047600 [Heracleum sosnowskyi]|uniref:Ubiquitin-like protease family profile domain-containing protein n=1 Tax=Heracleum sosnowskyi TaxID=360622 RepID=A0AAD8GU84_9APIA|nr:hypothetical protein POM88_047600 [Heracleum sosnowskyi]
MKVVDVTPDVETCAVDGEFDDVLVAAVEKNSRSPVQKVAVDTDIAENISEDVAEISNEVAAAAEEVEPVFNSLELFGPEVEKPNFKIEEVIAPDFDLSVAESAEAFVLQVAREISNANPPNDTLDEIENAFEKILDAKMKDAGVYKGKVVLLRNASGSGASGLGKVTPILPRRSIKLPAYLRSPFLQHYGSSSKETSEVTETVSLKSICPLDAKIGVLPDMDVMSEFYNWLDKGLLLTKNRKKFYTKENSTIIPTLKLGSDLISEKTWFHIIEYSSSNFSNSHVDVFFYYLRKLSTYSPDCRMRFTSTDCKFQKNIGSVFAKISEFDDIKSKITTKQDILDVINGFSLPFGTSWSSVDYVLFPIWLPEKKHWVLAVFYLSQREIRVRNTLSGEGFALIVKNALLPICTLLPHYLLLTNFYSRTDIDFTAPCYTDKSKTDIIRLLLQNDCRHCGSTIDSGLTMISFAEYFVMQKDFPKPSFDIAVHRSRIAFSFYSYAIAKQIYGYDSDHEYIDHGKTKRCSSKRTRAGGVSPQKTRAGGVQAKKRKISNVSPNAKKQMKA